MKINKGKKYLCIKDVVMEETKTIEFTKGKTYKSEPKGNLTNNSCDKYHGIGGKFADEHFKACGVETEPEFVITKEQIRIIEHQSVNEDFGQVARDMREWFPSAFETELEVGKWYISEYYLVCKQEGNTGFGFYLPEMQWETGLSHELNAHNSGRYREATQQEIEEALKAESVKSGYKEGVYIHRSFGVDLHDCVIDKDNFPKDMDYYYDSKEDYLEHYGFVVYSKGKWAEIIPTITKEQAEKELGKKIID